MHRTRSPRHWTQKLAIGIAIMATLGAFMPGCGVGYVVRSAYFQAELLQSRVPIDRIKDRDGFTPQQRAAFDRIADVKAYGKEIGLLATDNYETYADQWDRTIWNLTACPELSFNPVTWRFPVVGKVPYLGFFRRVDADSWAARLERDGYEVYLRTAGAYSTLGWFRDPVLPGMLAWDDARLANTVLHELAHATLWIKGSVSFNESFASFVGDKAAFAYLAARFGEDSPEYQRAMRRDEDLHQWRMLLQGLFKELEAVYTNPAFSDEQKRSLRATVYGSIADRARDAAFHEPERFEAAAAKGPWNNARLMQYRTYNTNTDLFEAIYEHNDRNLLEFIAAIDRITRGKRDPFEALRKAANPEM